MLCMPFSSPAAVSPGSSSRTLACPLSSGSHTVSMGPRGPPILSYSCFGRSGWRPPAGVSPLLAACSYTFTRLLLFCSHIIVTYWRPFLLCLPPLCPFPTPWCTKLVCGVTPRPTHLRHHSDRGRPAVRDHDIGRALSGSALRFVDAFARRPYVIPIALRPSHNESVFCVRSSVPYVMSGV